MKNKEISWDEFTEEVRHSFFDCSSVARYFKHDLIYPQYLFISICNSCNLAGAGIMNNASWNHRVWENVAIPEPLLPFTQEAIDILVKSRKLSRKISHGEIEWQFVLRALFEFSDERITELFRTCSIDTGKLIQITTKH